MQETTTEITIKSTLLIDNAVTIVVKRRFPVVTHLAPNNRIYDSDRSSRDDKVKSVGMSSTTATTPESVTAKTPSHDSGDDSLSERRHSRKPIGGIAVRILGFFFCSDKV